ncbi:MAG: hypothetical protein HPY55_15105 [Firmicutes bacterium]|nr:hypothetical protein [Bacillota bacterium]
MSPGCVNWVEGESFCFCRMHRDESCTECKYFLLNYISPKVEEVYAKPLVQVSV